MKTGKCRLIKCRLENEDWKMKTGKCRLENAD
jgi:hypothetical protein